MSSEQEQRLDIEDRLRWLELLQRSFAPWEWEQHDREDAKERQPQPPLPPLRRTG